MEGVELDEELALDELGRRPRHLEVAVLARGTSRSWSTNEREGSEIARRVIAAMLAERVKVLLESTRTTSPTAGLSIVRRRRCS